MLSRKDINHLLSVLLLLLTGCPDLLAQSTRQPEMLTIEDGLSQGYVNCLLQDKEGFLWFSTKNGLNRYDGYQFKVFTHNPFDSATISADWVRSINEYGNFLILGFTGGGFNIFDKRTFRAYSLWSKDLPTLTEVSVSQCSIDNRGNIIGNINLPNQEKWTVKISFPGGWPIKPKKNRVKVSCKRLFFLEKVELNCIGPNGDVVWNFNGKNLQSFDIGSGSLQIFDIPAGLIPENNTMLAVAPDGAEWISYANRIYRFNGKDWTTSTVDFNIRKIFFSTENEQIFIDSDSSLLVFQPKDFQTLDLKKAGAISAAPVFNNRILDVLQDKSGIIWMGTNGYGVIKYNPSLQRFKHLFQGESINKPILLDEKQDVAFVAANSKVLSSSDYHPSIQLIRRNLIVDCMMPDHQGIIWGLARVSGKDNVLLNKLVPGGSWEEAASIKSSDLGLMVFKFDERGNIWMAISNKLYRYEPSSNKLAIFDFNGVVETTSRANDLSKTNDGRWWIGTDKGLLEAVPKENGFEFHLYTVNPENEKSLRNNDISSLLADSYNPGILWVGTRGGGLNRLDLGTMEFTSLTTANGLPNDVIYGILNDDSGALWMSSNKGLIKYDPKSGAIRNYTTDDGLPTNEFNSWAYAKTANGVMYFGSVKGLVSFHPNAIHDNPVTPEVKITRLEVNNRSIDYGDSTDILSEDIAFTRQITLPFSQNNIGFELAALEFSIPSKNRFRYYLKGAEPEWAHETTDRRVSYLNLAPDKYTFFVKACNSDGVWSDNVTSLKITILPPWYFTTAAYIIYALLFLLFAFGLMRFFLYRQKLRHELVLEQKEAERLKELDNFKSRLYTNITHEFRTPLTVIQGMAKEVASHDETKPLQKLKNAAKLIERNGASLLRLINQILDLAKLEARSLKLNLVQTDMVGFTKYLIGSFESLAATKDIELFFYSEKEAIPMAIDKERLQSIISNLVSNALKFTPPNGKINVRVSLADNWKELLGPDHLLSVTPDTGHTGDWGSISVRDSGTGIVTERLPHIFDRFYQTDNQESLRGEGTGIGLALVKELVQLMKGTLAVKSREGEGTEFVIILPIIEAEDNKLIESLTTEEKISVDKVEEPDWKFEGIELSGVQIEERPALLLIEDNADVMEYLITCVEDSYRILTAQNGQQGIDKALEKVPDLIISDVMMPVKDGFEVVDTLKNDERTSHIPIILLTAKADAASRIKGLERGADAYLSKPFDKAELLVRLRKLLELRRKLQERYAGGQWATGSGQFTPAKERKVENDNVYEDAFLRKVQIALEENLDDENFGVPELCRALGMSRTQLHNKLKALTGKSATLYIRSLRLHKARQLLTSTEKTVSEVAFEVGFRHLQHFSTSFSEEFGHPPSQHRR